MKLPKLNPAYLFVFFAALAQGVMWVNLFSLIHHGILVYIGGIPAGLAIVGIVTRTANLLPRVQSKRARQAGWFFLGLVLFVEPIVLGVVNWWFMPAELQMSFISYIMAGGASLVISLVLVMGALVDRNLIPTEKPTPQPVTETPKPVGKPKKVAATVTKPAITDDELLGFFASNPGATNTDAAQHFSVSRQAIGKRTKKLYAVARKEQVK